MSTMIHDATKPVRSQPLKTILVVEDDVDMGYALIQVLKEETSHNIIFATDGFQALKMTQAVTPHLILIDYHLPKIDGLELVKLLRGTKAFAQVPMIFMSASPPKQVFERNDLHVLTKPFELEDLLTHIKLILETAEKEV